MATGPVKGKVMTQAAELAELRRWMREDIAGLHAKLDKRDREFYAKLDSITAVNQEQHTCLQKQLSNLDKKNEVNHAVIGTKIGLFVSTVALLVSSGVAYAFHRVFG